MRVRSALTAVGGGRDWGWIGDNELDNNKDAISSKYDVPPGKGGYGSPRNVQRYDEVFESAGALVEHLKGANNIGGDVNAAYGGGGEGEQRGFQPNMSNYIQ
jgi:hypothetical protein